ncbi:MAG: hypothetical protein H6982_02565 [Chromatiales bacterium]|nr:hypothetical protein [Chromatiales bacterium]
MEPEPADVVVDGLLAAGTGLLVVVTGAGVSLASGIPTFRGSDPDAVWTRDVTELGTNRYFLADPVGSWRWYTSRFDRVLDKAPNAAHHALVGVERWQRARGGDFVLVTQNVDTLHEKAGSEALVKVHGSADRVRCSRRGCVHGAPRGSLARAEVDTAAFHAAPSLATVPRCPACGALLRQHVLWFDEFYDEHVDYQWPRVLASAEEMAALLCVGTSFSVGVTELFVHAAVTRRVPAVAIDPGASAPPHPRIRLIREPAEVVLPEACARLGIDVAHAR